MNGWGAAVATVQILRFTGRTPVGSTQNRQAIMDSTQLAWTIAIIVVVVIILSLALFLGQRRKHAKDREYAENLRQSATADELKARENEAQAALAAANAQQAEVDAERLREEARNQAEEADSARSRAREQTMKAESLDPEGEIREHRATDVSDARRDPTIDPNQPEQSGNTGNERDPRDGGTAQQ